MSACSFFFKKKKAPIDISKKMCMGLQFYPKRARSKDVNWRSFLHARAKSEISPIFYRLLFFASVFFSLFAFLRSKLSHSIFYFLFFQYLFTSTSICFTTMRTQILLSLWIVGISLLSWLCAYALYRIHTHSVPFLHFRFRLQFHFEKRKVHFFFILSYL